jgi:hypothetical protein
VRKQTEDEVVKKPKLSRVIAEREYRSRDTRKSRAIR